MMKKLVNILAILTIFAVSGYAFASSDAPAFARANGGPEISMLKLDLDDFNAILANNGYPALNEVVVLSGGGGIGGTKLGPRVGGYGSGGQVSSINAKGDEVVLGMGMGGVVYEHGIYAQGKTDIAIGTTFGGGGLSVKLTDGNTQTTENYSKGFLIFEPRVNVHRQLSNTIGLEFIASYLFTYDFGSMWQIGVMSTVGPMRGAVGPHLGVRVTFGF